ncbi:MAG TPA: YggS family pyridoxal phosphate-dependent enzyme [Alphaproteobacteria bacterium]
MPTAAVPSPDERAEVARHLAEVKARVAAAAALAGRWAEDVTLIAVSKFQPEGRILAALEAGHRHFGENRVQEAAARWPALRARYPDLKLHFIGHLQSNKAADAVALADAIHSVDRPKLAKALAEAMDRQGRRPDCFVQVNTGEEPQKGGVLPAEADRLIEACRTTYRLPVVGLMCIPPEADDPAPHFALLATIAKRHGLSQLSMGMSADFETAIRLGATHVRVGTAIFGARPTHP